MKKILSLAIFATIACIASAQVPATEKLIDCQIYLYCDDEGELFVNGLPVIKATDYQRVFESKVPLKRGDIITATVKDKQGGPGGFWAILVLKNNAPLAASKDFEYTTAPNPDWRTNPALTGFKKPRLSRLDNFALGNAKNPQRAWSQQADRNFETLHFKFVVP